MYAIYAFCRTLRDNNVNQVMYGKGYESKITRKYTAKMLSIYALTSDSQLSEHVQEQIRRTTLIYHMQLLYFAPL